jgi:hypothetical protein
MDKLADSDSFFNDLLGGENESELLSKKGRVSILITLIILQTPEEIEQWCTKEDMTEVKRCVHLLKKGYEI